MEKDVKNNIYVYTCITESLCCAVEINTKSLFSYISIKLKKKSKLLNKSYKTLLHLNPAFFTTSLLATLYPEL